MRARHPQRLPDFSYVGIYRYSLRFCTDGRRPIFTSDAAVDLVRSQIARAASEQRFAVPAYCFMPDHLHLLVEGQDARSDLKRFMTSAKQYSGYYFKRSFNHALWQRYGVERVVRESEPAFILARYILENPVRARLVTRIEEYPDAGSFSHSLGALIEFVYDEASRQAHVWDPALAGLRRSG